MILLGFTGAGVLIYQSFQGWHDNPITTTIETRPITDIVFPKVTVCPPKDTYTDLNFDLKMPENMTLDNDTRNKLLNYALELLYNKLHDTIMTNLSKLEEDDRYYNWYHGYTGIQLPSSSHYDNFVNHRYALTTYAKSGNISTKNFGQKFDADEVVTDISYQIFISTPYVVQDNTNVTLHVSMERLPLTELSIGKEEMRTYWYDNLYPKEIKLYKNFTPPGDIDKFTILNRDEMIKIADLKKQDLKQMPGFKLSWYYTGIDMEELWIGDYHNNSFTKLFVRLANAIQLTKLHQDTVWSIVKKMKVGVSLDNVCDSDGLIYNDPYVNSFHVDMTLLDQYLHVKSTEQRFANISQEKLETAAEMLLYLLTCPGNIKEDSISYGTDYGSEPWFKTWYLFYHDLFKTKNRKQILLTLNRLSRKDDSQKMNQKLLKRTANLLTLNYEEIHKFIRMKKNNFMKILNVEGLFAYCTFTFW